MISSKYYPFPSFFKNNLIGRLVLDFIYKKLAVYILPEAQKKNCQVLVCRDVSFFLAGESKSIPITLHEDLYYKYLVLVDENELSKAIDSFISIANKVFPMLNLSLIRTYIYSALMAGPIQIIEHAKKFASLSSANIYYGSKHDLEYKIISKFGETKIKTSFSIRFLSLISNIFLTFKKINNYFLKSLKKSPIKLNKEKKIPSKSRAIIINVLEERRFGRILMLKNELEKNGYQIILYSALAKKETLRALELNPELKEIVIFETDFIGKIENKYVIINTNKMVKKFKKLIEPYLENIEYSGIPVFKLFFEELIEVIRMRMVEVEINKLSIDRLLSISNACGYIGMDNSIANSVWMNACQARKIPTFFYFYNATAVPYTFKMQVDSYAPTVWVLGGEKLLERFKNAFSKNHPIGNSELKVVGDLYLDVVQAASKKCIKKNLIKKYEINSNKKIITIISSYITSDFTSEIKRQIFLEVNSFVKKADCVLLIKAHPNEDIDKLKSEIKEWGISGFLIYQESLLEVLLCTDLMVMYFSESAQQAMQLGIPVISIINRDFESMFDGVWGYYSSGAVEVIGLDEDISDVLKRHLYLGVDRSGLIKRGREYAEKNFGSGDVSKKFAEIVRSHITC